EDLDEVRGGRHRLGDEADVVEPGRGGGALEDAAPVDRPDGGVGQHRGTDGAAADAHGLVVDAPQDGGDHVDDRDLLVAEEQDAVVDAGLRVGFEVLGADPAGAQ